MFRTISSLLSFFSSTYSWYPLWIHHSCSSSAMAITGSIQSISTPSSRRTACCPIFPLLHNSPLDGAFEPLIHFFKLLLLIHDHSQHESSANQPCSRRPKDKCGNNQY